MKDDPDRLHVTDRLCARQRRESIAGYLGGLEVGVVILASPLLLFPTIRPAWTAAALVALLLVWLARWAATGHPVTVTPLNISLLLLLAMVPVAVWVSALPELTLPKLTGLVLGVAAFRATVHTVRKTQHLTVAAALYLALGLTMAAVGLLSVTWPRKWPLLDPLLGRIPHLLVGLPGAEAGINPNELAGALLLFLPIALVWPGIRGSRQGWPDTLLRLVILSSIPFFGALLVLSQSRSAWIGTVAGLGAMAWIRWPRLRWLMVIAALLSGLGLWYAGPRSALAALFPAATGSEGQMVSTVTLEGRMEIWNRALYAIQDFAFTGCGLGTFRRVIWVLYPPFLISPNFDLGHAHNIFLQVALDLGLPGLVAYLGLTGTALWIGWQVARSTDCSSRWLGLGIVGALVAFHVYGLTDAIALGARPGLAFWILLALVAALWDRTRDLAQPAGHPEPEGT